MKIFNDILNIKQCLKLNSPNTLIIVEQNMYFRYMNKKLIIEEHF